MANDLAAIMPKILARSLGVLRERAVMPRLVNSDYGTEAAEKGDTIDVPIPTAVGTQDVVPAATPITSPDTTTEKVQITLDKWRQTDPIHLTDKQLTEVNRNEHFLPMQIGEGIKSLANYVNEQIHAQYTGIYGAYGTAATTPFASDVKGATRTRKLLNQQLCPKTDRRGVLDFDAEAQALELSPFADADKTMSAEVKLEGEIGRKYGIDWVADDAVTSHTAGTAASVQTADTGAVGDKTIAVDTGTGTYTVGDIITFAGHTQQYVITAAVADVSSATIAFEPGLVATVADDEAIAAPLATHVVNMVFHRDAFAFATRPLVSETTDLSLGNLIMSMQDPQTGIVLRLEISRQHKRVVWEFDILFGVKLVRPALAVRLLG